MKKKPLVAAQQLATARIVEQFEASSWVIQPPLHRSLLGKHDEGRGI